MSLIFFFSKFFVEIFELEIDSPVHASPEGQSEILVGNLVKLDSNFKKQGA